MEKGRRGEEESKGREERRVEEGGVGRREEEGVAWTGWGGREGRVGRIAAQPTWRRHSIVYSRTPDWGLGVGDGGGGQGAGDLGAILATPGRTPRVSREPHVASRLVRGRSRVWKQGRCPVGLDAAAEAKIVLHEMSN